MGRGQYVKSLEHRQKLSEALRGRKLSEETKHKMSLAKQSPVLAEPQELPSTLRPRTLAEFVGFDNIKKEIGMMVQAAKQLNTAPKHILIVGPPGSGKTSLAHLIAETISGPNIISTHASMIKKQIDLRNILVNLNKDGLNAQGEVVGTLHPTSLVLDEIHRFKDQQQELLYAPMEQRIFPWRNVDPHSGEVNVKNYVLPYFVLIGVSDRGMELTQPLLERFGAIFYLDTYQEEEIQQILQQAATKLRVPITEDAYHLLAATSKGIPRIALSHLHRIRNVQIVQGQSVIDQALVKKVFELIGIYEWGLNNEDVKTMQYLHKIFPNKVGLQRLAMIAGTSVKGFQNAVEGFLIKKHLLNVAPGGRLSGPELKNYLKRNHLLPTKEDQSPVLLEK